MKRQLLILLIPLLFTACNTTKVTIPGEVDLIEMNNLHFIKIVLNGEEVNLLIDSGATTSLLDITQAEKYGFEYLMFKKDYYIGLGGKQDIYVVYAFNMPQPFIPFLGADLSQITEYFIEKEFPIVGIVGADFLEKYDVKIDFFLNKMYLKSH